MNYSLLHPDWIRLEQHPRPSHLLKSGVAISCMGVQKSDALSKKLKKDVIVFIPCEM